MSLTLGSVAALAESARAAAAAWQAAGCDRLVVGLVGNLGAGKTTWVRALLGGLGHAGRVPSPTFTLLEHYEVGPLTVAHLDLYRIAEPGELEFLGLRDWLALPRVWLFVEWPERGGPALASALDLTISLRILADESRRITAEAGSPGGQTALDAWLGTSL